VIKQPWLLKVSAFFLIVAVYLVIDRSIFLTTAEKAQGTVESIVADNGTCGSNRRSHSCTKFKAAVRYEARTGGTHIIEIDAGSAHGHNAPESSARYRVGGAVEVVYSQRDPSQAYQDTLFGIWFAPILAGIAQLAALAGSLAEGRRRHA
jgi:hypothetical protein